MRHGGFAAALLLLAASMTAAPAAAAGSKEADRLALAGEAFTAVLSGEDAGVPGRLLEDCRCVAVFPGVVKGALGWGGRRGHGVMSCRDSAGTWSPPTFMTLTGGSFGLQIGVQKTDLVLFVMTEKSARGLLADEFTLGASGSVAAGPAGRSAEGATDLKLDAEIYSYARSKGLFAGLSLEGAHIGNDDKAIERFYGSVLTPQAIVIERRLDTVPEAAQAFLGRLP